MRPIRTVTKLIVALAFAAGCAKDNPVGAPQEFPDQTNGRITVVNNEATLAARMTLRAVDVPIDPGQFGKVAAPLAFSLTEIANIASPVVGGRILQATSVVLDHKNAYVSYNMAGSDCVGAIDVIQLRSYANPVLRSEATFTDTDVSSVCSDGSFVYLATATSNPSFASPSFVEAIGIQGGKLDLSEDAGRVLTSYVATSVAVSNGKVYVTTGNTGGMYTLSGEALGISSFVPLADARWVDCDGRNVVVAQGTPGRITVFDQATGALKNTFAFNGANIAESKSTARLIGGKALIAAGDGGVQVMNLADGRIVGSLPRLIVAGLDPARSVTNAVDGANHKLFISNGEAGVYVAESSVTLEDQTGSSSIPLTMLGQLRFANLQSVNHVAFDGEFLVVAAGLGGVKVVRVRD